MLVVGKKCNLCFYLIFKHKKTGKNAGSGNVKGQMSSSHLALVTFWLSLQKSIIPP